jgi:hypothetical protein
VFFGLAACSLSDGDKKHEDGQRSLNTMTSNRFQLSLSDEVLIAIGSVSAQWATLEYYMARATIGCSEKFKNPLSKSFKKTGFGDRREAFAEALTQSNVPPEIQDAGERLIARIASAEDKRHTIVHGMASELTTGDGPLPAGAVKVLIAREHPKYWFAEHFTIGQITAIVDEIADINGDLLRLYLYLYGAAPRP